MDTNGETYGQFQQKKQSRNAIFDDLSAQKKKKRQEQEDINKDPE